MALSATDPQPSITIHRPDPYPAKGIGVSMPKDQNEDSN